LSCTLAPSLSAFVLEQSLHFAGMLTFFISLKRQYEDASLYFTHLNAICILVLHNSSYLIRSGTCSQTMYSELVFISDN
jgi:hypothetical protein